MGMTDGPLDQFDAVAVGIGEPRRPEVSGAVWRGWRVRSDAVGGEASDSFMQVVGLNDQVVEAAGPLVGSWTSSISLDAHCGTAQRDLRR